MNPIITYHRNGRVKTNSYYNDAKHFHNEYSPAYTEYYSNGNLKYEAGYINGIKKFEYYYDRRGLEHGLNKPSYIEYDENGNKCFETYRRHGYLLNNKVAKIWYDKFGKIIKKQYKYYDNYIEAKSQKDFEKKAKRISYTGDLFEC